MPLTRHFYALDEVQAAVHYCGSRAAWKETVFWCRELALSGHASEAISALFESWLWHRGPFHMRWFVDAMIRLGGEAVSLDDLLVMAEALSRCSVKDHSLWTLFVSVMDGNGEESLFDRVTPRSPVEGFPSEEPLEVFLIRAIYQHKAGAAWWAARQLDAERVWILLGWYAEHVLEEQEQGWEALRTYDQLLGYRSDAYDCAIRGVVLLYMCLTKDQRSQSMASLPPLPQEFVAEWDLLLGRKAARLYTIPYHGMYGVTVRGRICQQETTVRELNNAQQEMTCACWEEMNLESCFPDDLPDEWTAEEKARSHGAGVLSKGEQVSLWGWMRRYMTGLTRLLWGRGTRLARKESVRLALEQVGLGDSPFSTVMSLPCIILSEHAVKVVKKQLAPVHKRRVVG